MKRITFTLPQDLAEVVECEARRRRQTTSALLRDLIEQSLIGPKEEPRCLTLFGLFEGHPGMIPSDKIDDYLREHWADDIARDRG